jgi:hypothetical protein
MRLNLKIDPFFKNFLNREISGSHFALSLHCQVGPWVAHIVGISGLSQILGKVFLLLFLLIPSLLPTPPHPRRGVGLT